MALAAENRSGRHHHLHAGVTEASAAVPWSAALPVLVADSAEDGMWNRGPAHFGLPFRGCPIYFSRITSGPLTQGREGEDACLILCYPNYWSNYFQQHNGTDYILNQWIQFGAEFACSFCDVFFPIFTEKVFEKTLFTILIWNLFFNWSITRKKCSG